MANGDVKEGVRNYRTSIKFYAGCHEKTQNEDYLNVILTNLQEIEKSLNNIDAYNLETLSEPQKIVLELSMTSSIELSSPLLRRHLILKRAFCYSYSSLPVILNIFVIVTQSDCRAGAFGG